ncbi:helix-turn-helix domain-containing protein [Pontibacter beigongshangensis]|uniref:helix-turn-helix domain-containing protein n=1 Tax=Pontibacter beigongshangensis TaxID=2574733 RepID=UPI00164EF2F6|nr:helix-turn-helix transcriptional regulator [Pontibacter beigongshangensis]
MIDRIKQLMEDKELSSTQFADGVEVPRAVISHILSGRNKPSLDVMLKILAAHRDVSMSWLLLGDGEMYSPEPSPPAASQVEKESLFKQQEHIAFPGQQKQSLENVQLEKGVKEVTGRSKPSVKEIERIVYFYSDKTFETFTPAC